MFDTIAISELQKSLSKIFAVTKGYRYVLANNKKRGLIVGKPLMEYLEETGVLEEYEDARLLELTKKEREETRLKIEKGDMSDFLTFDELCQSI